MNFSGKVFVFVEKKTEEKANVIGKLINKYGMSMNLIRIDSKTYLREKMVELTGEASSPRVFLNSRYIGGLTEVQMLEKKGRLKSLISTCKLEKPGKIDIIWSTQWEIFKIKPPMLFFPDPARQNIHTELTLYNHLDRFVLFKVQTTSPGKFCVRPVFGMVTPRGSQVIRFEMFMTTDFGSRDKFRVDSITMGPEFEKESFSKLNIREFFKNVPSMKQKIPCRFDSRIPDDFKIQSIDKKTVRVSLRSRKKSSKKTSKKKSGITNSDSPIRNITLDSSTTRVRRKSSSPVTSPTTSSPVQLSNTTTTSTTSSSLKPPAISVSKKRETNNAAVSPHPFMTPVVKKSGNSRSQQQKDMEKSLMYLEKSVLQHMTKYETMLDRQIHAVLTDADPYWDTVQIKEEIGNVDIRSGSVDKWKQVTESIGNKLNRLRDLVNEKDEKNHDTNEENDCVVCMERKRKVVFLPCKHMCTCEVCSEKCEECPMCRSKVESRLNVFI